MPNGPEFNTEGLGTGEIKGTSIPSPTPHDGEVANYALDVIEGLDLEATGGNSSTGEMPKTSLYRHTQETRPIQRRVYRPRTRTFT